MLLPPHNKVSVGGHVYVDNNTLHVQSGVTISTDSDFSEGETLLCDTVCDSALLLHAPYGKFHMASLDMQSQLLICEEYG